MNFYNMKDFWMDIKVNYEIILLIFKLQKHHKIFKKPDFWILDENSVEIYNFKFF